MNAKFFVIKNAFKTLAYALEKASNLPPFTVHCLSYNVTRALRYSLNRIQNVISFEGIRYNFVAFGCVLGPRAS